MPLHFVVGGGGGVTVVVARRGGPIVDVWRSCDGCCGG